MKEYSYGIAPYRIEGTKVYIIVGEFSKNQYSFFKGKIEFNESIIECLIREIKEECSFILNIEQLEKSFSQKNEKKDIKIFLIHQNEIEQINLNKENISYQEFEINDLYNKICKNQKKIVNDMILFFKNNKNFILRENFF